MAGVAAGAGAGDRFDGAVADFARVSADRTEADHAAFVRATGSGRAG